MSTLSDSNTDASSDPGFLALSKIAYDEAGLILLPEKASMIKSRLRHRLKALSINDLSDYCAYVQTSNGSEEKRSMISALTTNVSSFFREPHHFDQLVKDVVPSMISQLRNKQPVRIWSAGCSTGQEPYSIAMTLLEQDPIFGSADFKILATDIDPQVIETAKNGQYGEEKITAIDPKLTKTYFADDVDGQKVVRDTLKDIITFRELNLMGSWPMSGKFDAIFCRNVVIYFDAETQDKLWPRFHKLLKPHGLMFVGHSERISSEAFTSVGATAYAPSASEQSRHSKSQQKENGNGS